MVPKSPAEEAGIKKHDVLLTAGNTPLANVAALAKAVNEKKDNAVPIKLLRGGKTTIVNVTPKAGASGPPLFWSDYVS